MIITILSLESVTPSQTSLGFALDLSRVENSCELERCHHSWACSVYRYYRNSAMSLIRRRDVKMKTSRSMFLYSVNFCQAALVIVIILSRRWTNVRVWWFGARRAAISSPICHYTPLYARLDSCQRTSCAVLKIFRLIMSTLSCLPS